MFLYARAHPLFDPVLIEEIVKYCDGLGAHKDRPIDLTCSTVDFEPETLHWNPIVLTTPVKIQTHVKENGSMWYLFLWSNGDRSWEGIYFTRAHPELFAQYQATLQSHQ